jgi:hypothetical protein
MMLRLTAFSQTATDIQPVKSFPIPVVKLIIKDLISGDMAKVELKLTEQQLRETENKVSLKDSIIGSMRLKELGYTQIIGDQNQKFGVLEDYTKKVEFNLKKEKFKSKFKSILGGAAITALTVFLVTK